MVELPGWETERLKKVYDVERLKGDLGMEDIVHCLIAGAEYFVEQTWDNARHQGGIDDWFGEDEDGKSEYLACRKALKFLHRDKYDAWEDGGDTA